MSRRLRLLPLLAGLLAAAVACVPGGRRAAPGLTAIPDGPGRIRLRWQLSEPEADAFVLQRRAGDRRWAPAGESPLAGDARETVDAPGELRTVFEYRLAPVRGARRGRWSNVASALPVFRGRPLFGWLDVSEFIGDPTYPDPTAAIQAAIDRLSHDFEGPHVLWFPDGEYPVARTLRLEGRPGVQFIGESRGGVVLRWVGPPGRGPDDVSVMFHAEGSRDSSWRNLIWDAGCETPDSCFVVAFDQSFCGRLGSREYNAECDALPSQDPAVGLEDSGSAHLDSEFRNAYIGLRIGHYQVQDSEITVRRCRFHDNFIAVGVEDQNALDEWFWDCAFEGNWIALTNDVALARREFDPDYRPGRCRAQPHRRCFSLTVVGGSPDCAPDDRCDHRRRIGGDFDVMRGRFRGNLAADMMVRPGGEFTVRDSWSTGSGRFLTITGPTASPSSISLIGNHVGEFDPRGRYDGRAVESRYPGPLILLDNRFYTTDRQRDRGQAPVFAETFVMTDVMAVGNGYSSGTGITPSPDMVVGGPYDFGSGRYRLLSFGEQPIAARAVEPPPLPEPVDPLDDRPVYTVTDAALAQQVIEAARAAEGPAVVHFPSARYPIDSTLAIPAGSGPLLVTGDGAWTRLAWAGPDGGPLLSVDAAGGGGVLLRDLQLYGAGVRVERLDGDTRGALLGRLRVAASGGPGVVVDGIAGGRVDLLDWIAGGNTEATGLLIRDASAGRAVTAIWTAALGGNDWDIDLVAEGGGARLLVTSAYMEDSRHHLRLRGGGSGEVVVHGGKVATIVPPADPGDPWELAAATAAVDVERFGGSLSLAGNLMFIQPSGDPCCSDPAAVARGARVRQLGPEPLELRSFANILHPAADGAAVDDDVTPAVDYLRLGGVLQTRDGAAPLESLERNAGRLEWNAPADRPLAPERLEMLSSAVAGALRLLRQLPLPDDPDARPAGEAPAFAVDKLLIWDAADYGLALLGGPACRGNGECGAGERCLDAEGNAPSRLPGQCR